MKRRNDLISAVFAVCVMFSSPAFAMCGDEVYPSEITNPALERHFIRLKAKGDYPWGKINPYQSISAGVVVLSPDFYKLSLMQKHQALAQLGIGWDSLTKFEQKTSGLTADSGAHVNFQVNDSLGRVVYMQFGCGYYDLFTEYRRNQMHYLAYWDATSEKKGKYPLDPQKVKFVKYKFWKVIGYDKSQADYWIEWVPELGYFEVDIPSKQELHTKALSDFWNLAPRGYRYVVLDSSGEPLDDKTLK